MKLSDKDLRKMLHKFIASNMKYRNHKVDDEFALSSRFVVADVALIGEQLIGFEIKSDLDNLKRLPVQAKIYDNVFYNSFLVTTPKHILDSSYIIPDHWGVLIPDNNGCLSIMKEPEENFNLFSCSMLQLLKKKELKHIANFLNMESPGATKEDLLKSLLSYYNDDELKKLIGIKLRSRYKGLEGVFKENRGFYGL